MMLSTSNRRLAKNSIALYVRTFIILLVSLYTSRSVILALGVEDFGIYTIVGSVVVVFSFLSSSLIIATQRFLTIEIGRDNVIQQRKVFSISLTLVIILCLIVILLTESVGLWFVCNKLNMPVARMNATKVAYHLSILTFCLNILRTPYNAAIISHEKIKVFAFISVFEALLKLSIVFLFTMSEFDKLILYTSSLAVITAIINMVYWYYCIKTFNICKYNFLWDRNLFVQLMSFSGWNLLGTVANLATQNGLVFMINIFWGVTINAAYGIANQVNSAMLSFVSGFQTSFSPQITKAYANNANLNLVNLINRTSKFSFMLVFIPALIIILNMDFVLELWLDVVPNYTVEFSVWMVVCVVLDATSGPFNIAVMATGRIKHYQLYLTCSFLLDILLTYLLISFGINPSWVFLSRFLTRGVINMFIGLLFLKRQLKFNIKAYCFEVLFPILAALVMILPIPVLLTVFYSEIDRLIYSIVTIVLIGGIVYFKVLLTLNERIYLLGWLSKLSLRFNVLR